MRSIDMRFRSSAEPMPPEMWSFTTAEMLDFVAGKAPCAHQLNCIEEQETMHDQAIMTSTRQARISEVAQRHGESGERLLHLVGIKPE